MVERLPSSPLKVICAPNLIVLGTPMENTQWMVLVTPGSETLCAFLFASFPSQMWSNIEEVTVETLIRGSRVSEAGGGLSGRRKWT